MNRQEFTDEIERAINMVDQAKSIVDQAVYGTDMEAHFDAYGGYGFDQLLGNGNPYDRSLRDLIDAYDEKEEDE